MAILWEETVFFTNSAAAASAEDDDDDDDDETHQRDAAVVITKIDNIVVLAAAIEVNSLCLSVSLSFSVRDSMSLCKSLKTPTETKWVTINKDATQSYA